MTRDQVIEYAKDWVTMLVQAEKWGQFETNLFEATVERQDVLNACLDLAYNRTKEALVAYADEREAEIAAHERMLETIEATLQEEINNGV